MINSSVPFARWKKAVGLPDSFPRLGVLGFEGESDDDRLYTPIELEAKRTELLERLQGPALRVVVPLGHGATTLARWVVNRAAAECLQMRMIPLLVSLDDLVDHGAALSRLTELAAVEGSRLETPNPYVPGLTDSPLHMTLSMPDAAGDVRRRKPMSGRTRRTVIQAAMVEADEVSKAALGKIDPEIALGEAVHSAVARSLVRARWDRVTGNYRYAAVLDALDTEAATLQSKRAELDALLSPATVDWETVAKRAPLLADPDRLADFLAENDIRISVHLDLSCTRYGRLTVRDPINPEQSLDQETQWFSSFAVQSFLVQLKDMSEAGRGLARWERPGTHTVRVVEYVSTELNERFNSAFRAERTKVDMIAFDALDVFAVLAAHYPLKETDRRRPELVSAVITGGLIEEFVQDRRMALTSMIREFEDFLNSADNFTYHVQGRRLQGLPDEVDEIREAITRLQDEIDDHTRRLRALEGDGEDDPTDGR